jgi:hypothetical protein
MAKFDYFPSKYGEFCRFFPEKKSLYNLHRVFFLVITSVKIRQKMKHCQAAPFLKTGKMSPKANSNIKIKKNEANFGIFNL